MLTSNHAPPRPCKKQLYTGTNQNYITDFLGNTGLRNSYHGTGRNTGQPFQTFGKQANDHNRDGPKRILSFSSGSTNTDPGHDRASHNGSQLSYNNKPLPHSQINSTPDNSRAQVYSLADVSEGIEPTKANSFASSSYRDSNHGDDDGSTTSGSYVVDAKELVQDIDDIFFKDLIV